MNPDNKGLEDKPRTTAVVRKRPRRRWGMLIFLLLGLSLAVLRWQSLDDESGEHGERIIVPPNEATERQQPQLSREAGGEPHQPEQLPAGEPEQIVVRISQNFRPVNFKMAAVSHHAPLSDVSSPLIKRFPLFRGNRQRFGVLRFHNGREIPFVLDTAIGEYRLYVDANGNGDLRDDGPGLVNQGLGLFASRLELPMELVSGRHDLGANYQMWLYTGTKERPPASINYYARTQLQGEIRLSGSRFVAYLADNYPTDGDFTNDGIAIDLDRNGKIDLRREYFPADRDALINERRYRFETAY